VAVVAETEAMLEEEKAAAAAGAASATVGAVCNHASEILGCVFIFFYNLLLVGVKHKQRMDLSQKKNQLGVFSSVSIILYK
jgi:hypothetical protein